MFIGKINWKSCINTFYTLTLCMQEYNLKYSVLCIPPPNEYSWPCTVHDC